MQRKIHKWDEKKEEKRKTGKKLSNACKMYKGKAYITRAR